MTPDTYAPVPGAGEGACATPCLGGLTEWVAPCKQREFGCLNVIHKFAALAGAAAAKGMGYDSCRARWLSGCTADSATRLKSRAQRRA